MATNSGGMGRLGKVALASGALALALGGLGGCASDANEPVGHTKTTTKRTTDTPTEKTTVTETHQKDTTVYPR